VKMVTIPKVLLAYFDWDEHSQEYFQLVPRHHVDGTTSFIRFRVEPREGYVVLVPQPLH
jgi:hypothetical protein